jgi:phosphate transport system protein
MQQNCNIEHLWRSELPTQRRILDSGEQALKTRLDDMFKHVSNALDKSLLSLRNYDESLAAQVVDEDKLINALHSRIEEEAVHTIALQQPVAKDLRILMTDIHISMELERIADHAAAIASIVLKLEAKPDDSFVKPISDITEKCRSMLKLANQSYDEADESLARELAAIDDEIDSAEMEFNDLMFQEMCSQPGNNKTCTYLLWITHNLERIGDRITNIAERVVYMKTSVTPDLN